MGFLQSLFGGAPKDVDQQTADRIIGCVQNYWDGLGGNAEMRPDLYDPSSQQRFHDEFREVSSFPELHRVRLKTSFDRSKAKVMLKREDDASAQFIITAPVQYYFTKTDGSLISYDLAKGDLAPFGSEETVQQAEFRVTCGKQNGTYVLRDIKNSIF